MGRKSGDSQNISVRFSRISAGSPPGTGKRRLYQGDQGVRTRDPTENENRKKIDFTIGQSFPLSKKATGFIKCPFNNHFARPG
jgi:hypothetical protein